jgi:hypothetical protein
VVQESASGKGGEPRRFRNREEMLVIIEDGKVERRRRFLPGRPLPYQRLAEPKNVTPIRRSAVEKH